MLPLLSFLMCCLTSLVHCRFQGWWRRDPIWSLGTWSNSGHPTLGIGCAPLSIMADCCLHSKIFCFGFWQTSCTAGSRVGGEETQFSHWGSGLPQVVHAFIAWCITLPLHFADYIDRQSFVLCISRFTSGHPMLFKACICKQFAFLPWSSRMNVQL